MLSPQQTADIGYNLLNSSQRATMTKYTREHFDGVKNPSNEPAKYGLKKLKAIARAKWMEREKENINGDNI
jgi:hypothetical protein